MLGRLLFAVAILGIIASLCGCPPPEEPPLVGDNIVCNLEGLEEKSVRGRIRTSFDYKGGDCECDCTGVDFDFECTITSTGGL